MAVCKVKASSRPQAGYSLQPHPTPHFVLSTMRTPTHTPMRTPRGTLCSSGPLSLPGKAAAALTREPPGWKLTLEKPRGMRTKRNPSIASFPGPRFQIPPLTCTLPPDWSRQHSWDAPHYFSGSTLFMPLPAHHAPSSCYGPVDQALITHIVRISSRQITPAPGLEFHCVALTGSPHPHTPIHLSHSTVSPECKDPGSALSNRVPLTPLEYCKLHIISCNWPKPEIPACTPPLCAVFVNNNNKTK